MKITAPYNRLVSSLPDSWVEQLTLLFVRVSLAGIFWRSGRTKVDEGSWLSISENTRFLFAEEYKGVPLPSDLAAVLDQLDDLAIFDVAPHVAVER